ncbi:hypothetical protein DVA80_21340, partial [Acinetobacter baumannii]
LCGCGFLWLFGGGVCCWGWVGLVCVLFVGGLWGVGGFFCGFFGGFGCFVFWVGFGVGCVCGFGFVCGFFGCGCGVFS